MNDPKDDQKLKDEEENITAHPSGAEGAPAQLENAKDNKDLISEHSSHKEPELSEELEEAGVTSNQPKSLREELKEPLSEVSKDSNTESNAFPIPNISKSDEKGDIGSGKTWLGAILSKINKFKVMFGSKSHVNEPKSV